MGTVGRGSWVRRHKWLTAVLVVLVLGWAGNAGADEAEREGAGGSSVQERSPASDPSGAEPDVDSSEGATKPTRDTSRGPRGKSRERQTKPSPTPALRPVRTYLVSRVVDGDTLELGNGQTVRLVGIDTPEVGECGYDKAAARLAALTLGTSVRLTISDEDRDQYGRLLRYVNVGDTDAGLRLIKNGLAIARYDSRDGYGYHPREPVYVAADRGAPNLRCPRPKPQPLVSQPATSCAPGYSPCVPPYPPDVDCADVDGPVRVTGSDPHGLDADGDGVACE